MNEWIESGDANAATVSVWTPWGEQKVMQSDRRALLRRAQARLRRGDDAVAQQSLPEASFSAGL
jgi:hypothetical protein